MSLLLPESGLLFWMLLSFLVVFVVLAKYGFPVIVKMVEERKAYIDHSMEVAREANEKFSKLKEDTEALIASANKEQGRIVREAMLEREKIIADARKQAETVAQKELDEVRKQIQQEKEEAIRAIRRQVAELSVDIAELKDQGLDDQSLSRNRLEKMDIGIISMRYAKALMGFAKDKGTEDIMYKQCKGLSESFSKYSDFRAALENPVLPIDEKYALVCTAAVGDGKVDATFADFIKLVLKHRREKLLQYMCLSFMDLYRQSKHIGVARLITAVPVSQKVADRIRNSASSMLHARMELQTEVNPALEGGFIFDINDYRLDASIATQLKRVKQQFIDKNRRIV